MRSSWLVLGMFWVAFASGLAIRTGQAQVGLEAFPKLQTAQDWPWWRGASRDGHAIETGSTPVEFGPGKNELWSARVPGRGHSSPILVQNRLFLLTADERNHVHLAIAYESQTGKQVWSQELNRGGFPKNNHRKNTEASPTLASDGERLFATLFHHGAVWLVALSLDGDRLWEKRIDAFNPREFEYGYAPSPVLYGDLVILAYEYDGPSAMVAVRRTDGEMVWKTNRSPSISFSSPVVTSFRGKDYLVISGMDTVSAYEPLTGKLIWATPGTAKATCGTVVWENGIVFASGGYPASETIAIELETGKTLWRNRQKAYEQSMVAVGGHLYSFTDSGIMYCWDGKTGKERWRQRLEGPVSASGVVVGDLIYWGNEAGTLWVFRANPERYQEVAKNQIGEELFASPAVVQGKIYVRFARNVSGQRQEFLSVFGTSDQ